MAKEMLDIFDANYNHIGVEDRKIVHEQGLWHHTFHCWIIQPNGKLLLQLRSKEKSSGANQLGMSAGGHLETGETPMDGVREIEEEIGLKVDFEDLSTLGVSKSFTERTGYLNKEFVHTYLYQSKIDISKYKQQESEVSGLFEFDLDDWFKLFSREVEFITAEGVTSQGDSIIREFSIEDFVKREDSYFIKIGIMAERLLEGEKYLAI